MSVELIDEAILMIDKAGIDRPYLQSKFRVEESQINDAEEILGLSFPDSYRYFLLNFGSGDFKGIEFYGLIPNNNELEEIPNTVWFTKDAISSGDIQNGFIVVEDLGDGAFACLDINLRDSGECPVVLCESGESLESGEHLVLAHDFGRYFLNRMKSAVKE